MKFRFKRLRKMVLWFVGVFFILFIGLFLLGLTIKFSKSQEKIEAELNDADVSYRFGQLNTTIGHLRYLETGNTEAETVLLFVHGAPGSLDAFLACMKHPRMNANYHLISMDRPGYGPNWQSDAEISIKKQAEAMAEIFRLFPEKKFILVGHSYGAPVVAYMGHLNPEQTLQVILAGGAVAPEYERFEWLASICNFKPFRYLMSHENTVATDEKLNHQSALIEIQNIWTDYPVPLLVMHGNKDWLVPFSNVEFLENRVPSDKFNLVTLGGEGHFFVFNQPELIEKHLINSTKLVIQ